MNPVGCWKGQRGGLVRGFSLTEMIVVLGIILVVMGMTMTGAVAARRAARQTLCLTQLRNIGMAVTNYSNRYDGALPLGSWGDVPGGSGEPTESPMSARGFGTLPGDPAEMYGVGAGPLQTIRECLQSFMGTKDQTWRCPNQLDARGPVLLPFKGSGWAEDDRGFRPGYRFMATLDMRAYMYASNGLARQLTLGMRSADMLVRNVAGLKHNRIRTLDRAGADRIVLAFDSSVTFHSRETRELYELAAGEKPSLKVNMVYLDGHAEEREFRGRDGFVGLLHGPVAQRWYGSDFESAFAWAFVFPPPSEVQR